ncbi:hypothetical protein GW950_00110 [Candidatus Wolfebacteria bacterium]|nr:hypothetical protein [Candidatus Wolfebacteria bacterium]
MIAVVAIFYSNGWRFDLETFQINKLGALYFDVSPGNASIQIDKANFEFSPGFLRSGTLVANLFPKTYTVTISKEGYQTWRKELEVLPSLVTHAPPVILLPEKIELNKPLAEEIKNFWSGPKYIATLKNNGILTINSKHIIGNSVADWSKDGERVITTLDDTYFSTNINSPTNSINLNLMFRNLQGKKINDKSDIKEVKFLPEENNQFIVWTDKGLYLVDTTKYTIIIISDEAVSSYVANNEEIIFSYNNSLMTYKPSLNTKEPLTNHEFNIITNIQISPSGYYVVTIENNGSLSVLNRYSLELEHISGDVTSAYFSPNSNKIAYITKNNDLFSYPLVSATKLTQEKTARFNLGTIDKDITWHKKSEHLFIKYPSSLYLLEANALPPINLQVIDLKTTKYSYDDKKDVLYILKGSNLYDYSLGN